MRSIKKGFTLVELIAVLVIIAVIGMIVYPRVNNIVEANKKKAFIESVKSTIRSYDSYLASENYPDIGEIDITSGVIPTIDKSNWETGTIMKFDDNIYVENFYDGNFCAFGYENSLVVTRGECKSTTPSCFVFDQDSKTITDYNSSSSCGKTVIIPSEIKGVSVEHIGDRAFYDKGIDYVILPNTLISIGEKSFAHNKISSITIPNNIIDIGIGAFNNNKLPDQEAFIYKKNSDNTYDISTLISYGGKKKNNIVIPENVVTIEQYAFENIGIESITLPSGIQTIKSYAFYNNKLENIEIPSSLKYIENHAFAVNKIKTLTLPSTLESIGNWAFEKNLIEEVSIGETISFETGVLHNNKLTTVDIPSDWTVIPNSTFQDNLLTEVNLSSNINSINQYAFYHNAIVSIDLKNVNYIGDYAFTDNNIYSLHIPTSVSTIGNYAFQSNGMAELTFASNCNLEYISTYAFQDNKLTSLVLPSKLYAIDEYAFKDNKLTTLTLNEGLEEIEWGAFMNNELTSVSYPSTLKYLSNCVFNNNNFSGSNAITYAINDDGTIDYSSIIGYAGQESSITIPSGVTEIKNWAFEYAPATNVTLPEGLLTIGVGAFSESAVANINFPNSLVDIQDNAFFETQLKKVHLGNNLNKIGERVFYNTPINDLDLGTSVKQIGLEAFCYDNQIKTLTIPDSIEFLGLYAFFDAGLTSLTMPQNKYINIMGGVFNYNSLPESQAFLYGRNEDGTIDYSTLLGYGGLDSTIRVPNTVKTLGGDSLAYNYHVNKIILPEGLREIGYKAFYDCEISSIDLPQSLVSIDEYAFGYNQISTILIPEGVSYIHPRAFTYEANLNRIKINKSINSIEGAPWGATSAIVEWLK